MTTILESASTYAWESAAGRTLCQEVRVRRLDTEDAARLRGFVGQHSCFAGELTGGCFVVEARTLRNRNDGAGLLPRYYDEDMADARTPMGDAWDGWGVYDVCRRWGDAVLRACGLGRALDLSTATPGIVEARRAILAKTTADDGEKRAEAKLREVRQDADDAYGAELRARRIYSKALVGEADPAKIAEARAVILGIWSPKVQEAECQATEARARADRAADALEALRRLMDAPASVAHE